MNKTCQCPECGIKFSLEDQNIYKKQNEFKVASIAVSAMNNNLNYGVANAFFNSISSGDPFIDAAVTTQLMDSIFTKNIKEEEIRIEKILKTTQIQNISINKKNIALFKKNQPKNHITIISENGKKREDIKIDKSVKKVENIFLKNNGSVDIAYLNKNNKISFYNSKKGIKQKINTNITLDKDQEIKDIIKINGKNVFVLNDKDKNKYLKITDKSKIKVQDYAVVKNNIYTIDNKKNPKLITYKVGKDNNLVLKKSVDIKLKDNEIVSSIREKDDKIQIYVKDKTSNKVSSFFLNKNMDIKTKQSPFNINANQNPFNLKQDSIFLEKNKELEKVIKNIKQIDEKEFFDIEKEKYKHQTKDLFSVFNSISLTSLENPEIKKSFDMFLINANNFFDFLLFDKKQKEDMKNIFNSRNQFLKKVFLSNISEENKDEFKKVLDSFDNIDSQKKITKIYKNLFKKQNDEQYLKKILNLRKNEEFEKSMESILDNLGKIKTKDLEDILKIDKKQAENLLKQDEKENLKQKLKEKLNQLYKEALLKDSDEIESFLKEKLKDSDFSKIAIDILKDTINKSNIELQIENLEELTVNENYLKETKILDKIKNLDLKNDSIELKIFIKAYELMDQELNEKESTKLIKILKNLENNLDKMRFLENIEEAPTLYKNIIKNQEINEKNMGEFLELLDLISFNKDIIKTYNKISNLTENNIDNEINLEILEKILINTIKRKQTTKEDINFLNHLKNIECFTKISKNEKVIDVILNLINKALDDDVVKKQLDILFSKDTKENGSFLISDSKISNEIYDDSNIYQMILDLNKNTNKIENKNLKKNQENIQKEIALEISLNFMFLGYNEKLTNVYEKILNEILINQEFLNLKNNEKIKLINEKLKEENIKLNDYFSINDLQKASSLGQDFTDILLKNMLIKKEDKLNANIFKNILEENENIDKKELIKTINSFFNLNELGVLNNQEIKKDILEDLNKTLLEDKKFKEIDKKRIEEKLEKAIYLSNLEKQDVKTKNSLTKQELEIYIKRGFHNKKDFNEILLNLMKENNKINLDDLLNAKNIYLKEKIIKEKNIKGKNEILDKIFDFLNEKKLKDINFQELFDYAKSIENKIFLNLKNQDQEQLNNEKIKLYEKQDEKINFMIASNISYNGDFFEDKVFQIKSLLKKYEKDEKKQEEFLNLTKNVLKNPEDFLQILKNQEKYKEFKNNIKEIENSKLLDYQKIKAKQSLTLFYAYNDSIDKKTMDLILNNFSKVILKRFKEKQTNRTKEYVFSLNDLEKRFIESVKSGWSFNFLINKKDDFKNYFNEINMDDFKILKKTFKENNLENNEFLTKKDYLDLVLKNKISYENKEILDDFFKTNDKIKIKDILKNHDFIFDFYKNNEGEFIKESFDIMFSKNQYLEKENFALYIYTFDKLNIEIDKKIQEMKNLEKTDKQINFDEFIKEKFNFKIDKKKQDFSKQMLSGFIKQEEKLKKAEIYSQFFLNSNMNEITSSIISTQMANIDNLTLNDINFISDITKLSIDEQINYCVYLLDNPIGDIQKIDETIKENVINKIIDYSKENKNIKPKTVDKLKERLEKAKQDKIKSTQISTLDLKEQLLLIENLEKKGKYKQVTDIRLKFLKDLGLNKDNLEQNKDALQIYGLKNNEKDKLKLKISYDILNTDLLSLKELEFNLNLNPVKTITEQRELVIENLKQEMREELTKQQKKELMQTYNLRQDEEEKLKLVLSFDLLKKQELDDLDKKLLKKLDMPQIKSKKDLEIYLKEKLETLMQDKNLLKSDLLLIYASIENVNKDILNFISAYKKLKEYENYLLMQKDLFDKGFEKTKEHIIEMLKQDNFEKFKREFEKMNKEEQKDILEIIVKIKVKDFDYETKSNVLTLISLFKAKDDVKLIKELFENIGLKIKDSIGHYFIFIKDKSFKNLFGYTNKNNKLFLISKYEESEYSWYRDYLDDEYKKEDKNIKKIAYNIINNNLEEINIRNLNDLLLFFEKQNKKEDFILAILKKQDLIKQIKITKDILKNILLKENIKEYDLLKDIINENKKLVFELFIDFPDLKNNEIVLKNLKILFKNDLESLEFLQIKIEKQEEKIKPEKTDQELIFEFLKENENKDLSQLDIDNILNLINFKIDKNQEKDPNLFLFKEAFLNLKNKCN